MSRKAHTSAVIAAGAVALIIAAPASAATTSTTMPVTAVTVNACVVVATPLVFGTINQIGGSANDSTATLALTCTPGTAYAVGLDQGLHATGGVRQMVGALPSSLIPYNLYSNSARTTTWGNTVGTDTVGGTAGATPASLTVYGRIPANSTLVTAGAYADVVTVTVTF